MTCAKLDRARLMGGSLLLLASLCFPFSAFSQSDDERVVRELINNFFTAYQKGDWKTIESLFDAKSPDYPTAKEKTQKIFAENENLETKDFNVAKVALDGDQASIVVTVEMKATDRKTKSPAAGFGKMKYTLRAGKEAGSWKLLQFKSSGEQLAEKLLAAKTDQERKAALKENQDLVTGDVGAAVANQALSLLNARKYPDSFTFFELARDLSLEAGDKPGALVAWRGMGIAQYYQGDFSRSGEYLQQAMLLAQELGDKRKVTNLNTNLGILYQDKGETAKALEYYQTSLKEAEELGAKDLAASALINLGTAYRIQGNYPKALEVLRRALDLRGELGDKGNAGIALNRIGLVNFDQGNFAEALQYFQEYLKIANELNDRGYMNSALFNIGLVYYGQKNFARALENFQKALSIKEELGDKAGIANTLNSIGVVYEGQRDYAKALEYYRKSMALSEPLGFKPYLTSALHNTGNVYLAQGDPAKALEAFEKSLKACEEMDDKGEIAQALNSIGLALHKQRNYARALDFEQRGLSIAESIGYKDQVANSLQSISEIYYDQNNYAKSLEYAGRATTLARQVGNREVLWQALTSAGNAHRALEQNEAAQRAFDEAIASIESVRANIAGGEQQQEQFFENKVSPYQGMIGLLLAHHKDAEALSYAERSKARVLLDVLTTGKLDIAKSLTVDERNRERTMRNILTSLNTQIAREKARTQPDSPRLADLNGQLEKARLEYDTFQTNLYAAHPDLKVQRAEAKPITMQQVSDLIPDSQTALLEFVVSDDKTYLFVSTRRASGGEAAGLKTFEIGIKRKDLTEKAEMFRGQLARRDLGFGQLAHQLYDLLIKPAQAQIDGKTHLLIVPDGALWELPFQALQSAQGHYLLEDHAVSYVPSCSVLQEMVALRRKRINKTTGQVSLLAFGNPTLGNQTLERVGLTRGEENLLPLPETEREVKYLSQLYGETQSKVFVASEASEDRVKAEAPKFTILHLATHGILNDASPLYSQIVLSQGNASAGEDGLLEAWEIMKMDLKADLVVLSACETARGRVGEGEGMIGLTWALFVAGSPTNVVTQWKVDSASTTKLMIDFHRNLKSELARGKAELGTARALQRAALGLLRTNEYRHPFYWAGFVVVGDGF